MSIKGQGLKDPYASENLYNHSISTREIWKTTSFNKFWERKKALFQVEVIKLILNF